ncbi:hypothetical protein [Aliiroseovarius sp. F20344]|uniref:hypothetical protein n=1 Tax=Aliiroseovarius sp. F20344 TaxID=2926414 RepID=UPI001FF51C58|nr:hypothetical protein [Aliiroseovarius sp. F20344]MCK0142924.1 hypothetical protein [Aliiroseovarius sp. F20344]
MFGVKRYRVAAFGAMLALLSACATPQQQCIARETSEYRAVTAQIAKLEETLARGYALHRQSVPYTDTRICYTKDKKPFPCRRTRFHTIETPVSVDMDDVQKKLARLKAHQRKLEPRAIAARDACVRAYRE